MKSIIAFAAIFLVCVLIGYQLLTRPKPLPIYNPNQVNTKLVEKDLQNKSKGHRVGAFSLKNQYGEEITEADYENKVYVADFFFTRCAGICPVMSGNMQKLQTEFLNNEQVKLISHSVTPAMDSVPVLFKYAQKYNASKGKWNITTGSKKHIYELARRNYFAAEGEGDGGMQDFIHTENFVLVDKEKRIRGFYDGTSKASVEELAQDIYILLEEYE